MIPSTLPEITQAINGRLPQQRYVTKVVTNPKAAGPGSLCLLLRPIVSEDELLADLARRRVAGIVVGRRQSVDGERWAAAGIEVIRVRSPRKAFFRLAAYCRSRFAIPVVQVVGSAGKSTTKEMVAAVLHQHGEVLESHHNSNGPHGVAFTLLQLEQRHRAAVFETGMLGPGVIKGAAKMIKPTIGIVTSLQHAHFHRMKSMEAIINAKAELLSHLSPEGCLILNREDPNMRLFPTHRYSGQAAYVGFSDTCDLWAEGIEWDGEKTQFVACTATECVECNLWTFGRYNVLNALAALMAGMKSGLTLQQAGAGLANFRPLKARLTLIDGKDGMTLVNDNYNANPESTRLLLEELPAFARGRPLLLIMGDIEGPSVAPDYARQVHFELGQQIGRMPVAKLIAVGLWAEEYCRGALAAGLPAAQVCHFADVAEALPEMELSAVPGGVVVAKGSAAYIEVSRLLNPLRREIQA